MPLLVCAAQKCVYNDGMYCSKGDIKVGGESASTPRRPAVQASKSVPVRVQRALWGTPSQHIDVDCEACRCKYNEDCKCHADKIGITGAAACHCEQTECGTFDQQ